MRAKIAGLAGFGLTISQLWKLNPATILDCHASARRPSERTLLAMPPAERKRRVREQTSAAARRIERLWPAHAARSLVRESSGVRTAVAGKLTVSELRSLVRNHQREIGFVLIRAIGRRKQRKLKRRFEWYGVIARFAAYVEGQTAGLQEYEDVTFIVKGWSAEDAVRRLRPRLKAYGTPYLNLDYRSVSWQFEEILKVDDVFDPIDESGTEIISQFRSRRFKRSRARSSRKK